MDSKKFGIIVNNILDKEAIDLTTFATKCNVDRSYISKLINSVKPLTVGVKVQGKVKKQFPTYFGENHENNATPTFESLLVQLMQKQNQLMDMQNRLLKDTVDPVKEKINNIDSTTQSLMSGLYNVATRQRADRETQLRSLARLEGKEDVDSLIKESNKRVTDLLLVSGMHDTDHNTHKEDTAK